MTERTPRDLRGEISSFLRRADRGGGARARAQAASVWREAVGPEIAAHTHAAAVRRGELIVHVSSATWATELQALSSHLTGVVNEAAGEELISGIRFTVSRVVRAERDSEAQTADRDAFYRHDRVEPVPLTDVERAQIEEATRGVDDEVLREALVRAIVADLEWKRGSKAASEGSSADSEKPSGEA